MIPDTVFTLDKAKAHLRVPHDEEDAVITIMLDAAVAECERLTRRAWTARDWSVAIDSCDVALSCGCDSAVFHAELSPATAKVFVADPADPTTEVEVDQDQIFLSTRFGHTVVSVNGWSAIPKLAVGNIGRIDYEAAPPNDVVPADVYAAAMLFLGDLYENREGQIVGTIVAQNATAEILLRSYVIEMYV